MDLRRVSWSNLNRSPSSQERARQHIELTRVSQRLAAPRDAERHAGGRSKKSAGLFDLAGGSLLLEKQFRPSARDQSAFMP
jgi:hypothetical protein